jgi:pyruvate dehydrogenase E1 component alpha subunit
MFGDGATNIGYFHEALNMARVWNLPVLWVCENNLYGMGTSVDRASAVGDIIQKAEGYGMKNECIDGMDVLSVRESALRMIAEIRAGSGPQLLEVNTYRFRGHSMGDPERYRKPDEIHKYEENDPIGMYRKYLLEHKIASETAITDMINRAEEEVTAAVEFAENSPEPGIEYLTKDIYVEEV